MEIKFVKLSEFAFAPTRATPESAGLDLKSAYEYTVDAGKRIMVKTDLAIKLPEHTYGRIASRSGLALNLKHGVITSGGVIDFDYRGNICVILVNHGEGVFKIERGDRIAQLICEKVTYPLPVECDRLDETERGSRDLVPAVENE